MKPLLIEIIWNRDILQLFQGQILNINNYNVIKKKIKTVDFKEKNF